MEQVHAVLDGIAPMQVPSFLLGSDLIGLAVVFVILAVVAMIFGSRGIAGLSMDIAKWLVIIFIVLAIISLIL